MLKACSDFCRNCEFFVHVNIRNFHRQMTFEINVDKSSIVTVTQWKKDIFGRIYRMKKVSRILK